MLFHVLIATDPANVNMLRETNEKWTKMVSEWYPRDGERTQGRQTKRWEMILKNSSAQNG